MQRQSIADLSHTHTATLMREEVEDDVCAHGNKRTVVQRVGRPEISGTSQRFKLPITAECSSNGIIGTRRVQMAPNSSES